MKYGHRVLGNLLHVFDHHHGVGPRRQGLPGIDKRKARLCGAEFEKAGLRLAGAKSVVRADRDAVHGGAVVVGHRESREHRLVKNSPDTLLHRHDFRSGRDGPPIDKQVSCFGKGFLLEEACSCHGGQG